MNALLGSARAPSTQAAGRTCAGAAARRRTAGRLHRQGRCASTLAAFRSSRRQHGRHEGRHGRQRLASSVFCRRWRRARPRSMPSVPSGRENSPTAARNDRRHVTDNVGADDRDHQYRRRGPPRPCRRPALRQQALQAEVHGEYSRPSPGAIIVALGHEYAGLFSKYDTLADAC